MTGRLKVRGPLAWWMARTYHVSQIPGLRRKFRAVVDWTVSLPFSRDVAEVGSIGHPRRLAAAGFARRRRDWQVLKRTRQPVAMALVETKQ